MAETKTLTLNDIKKFFGDVRPFDSLKAFRDEWTALSDTDKEQIKGGLNNGTLTY